jgi:hypothetical protein
MVSWPLGNWKLVIEIGLLKFAPQAPSVSSTEMEICHKNTKAPNPHQNKKRRFSLMYLVFMWFKKTMMR